MPQRPTFNELADVQVQENSGSHSATVTGLRAGEAQRACLTLAAPLFKTLLAGIDPGATERRMTFAVDSTDNELISELLITTHDTTEWAGSALSSGDRIHQNTKSQMPLRRKLANSLFVGKQPASNHG